jgi:ferric-dicitrate binding protein FerR (iron transport regulator)
VATLAIAAWLAQPLYRQGAGPVATAALVAGDVQVRHGDGEWRHLAAAGTVAAGDELMTSATGRVALHWRDGVEVRLDSGTRLDLTDAQAANLRVGGIYVDAGRPGGVNTRFTLTTPLGEVRHLGTQYLVRTAPDAVHVSVREGSVAFQRSGVPVIARAGERVTVSAAGDVARGQVGARDPEWAWLETITPPFAIEGRSLDEFLTWAARETGRTLVYESPAAAREAESIQLKGAVTGLGPDAAIAAVLTTTPSLQAELGESQLRLHRSAD